MLRELRIMAFVVVAAVAAQDVAVVAALERVEHLLLQQQPQRNSK